jgi:predicted NUDIX family NTP pyrophosphohydrolase
LFRRRPELQVLLVHPGGPFWSRKDAGAWTIPKGEIDAGEEPLAAATREFAEETGCSLDGPFHALAPVTQKGGKVVQAWAVEGDFDPAGLRSQTITIEWPPRSGRMQSFPEVDRAAWFTPDQARGRINPAQAALVDQLSQVLDTAHGQAAYNSARLHETPLRVRHPK